MRSTGSDNLVPYDPEIERTLKAIRKIAREAVAQAHKMAEDRETAMQRELDELRAQLAEQQRRFEEERLMHQQRDNRRQEEQTRRMKVQDYIKPTFDGIHFAIAPPAIGANNFKMDSGTM